MSTKPPPAPAPPPLPRIEIRPGDSRFEEAADYRSRPHRVVYDARRGERGRVNVVVDVFGLGRLSMKDEEADHATRLEAAVKWVLDYAKSSWSLFFDVNPSVRRKILTAAGIWALNKDEIADAVVARADRALRLNRYRL